MVKGSHKRIVSAMACVIQAMLEIIFTQQLLKLITGIFTPPIGMKNNSCGVIPLP